MSYRVRNVEPSDDALPGRIYQGPPSSSDANLPSPTRSEGATFDSQLFHRLAKPKYASASPPPSQASRNENSPTILEEAAVVVSTHQCAVASTVAPRRRGPVSSSKEQDVKREKARRLNRDGSSSPAPIQEQCRGIIRAGEQQRERNLRSRDMDISSSRQATRGLPSQGSSTTH